MANSTVRFYAMHAGDAAPAAAESSHPSGRLWRPSLREIVPAGLPCFPYVIWWFMHFLRIFRNSGYCVLVVYDDDQPVHRCVVTPGWFRFPFMAANDLQIGDVWTREDHRRRGLATFGLSEVLRLDPCRERRYWYLAEEQNIASVSSAERLGFSLVGRGVRTSPRGIRAIGRYVINETRTIRHTV